MQDVNRGNWVRYTGILCAIFSLFYKSKSVFEKKAYLILKGKNVTHGDQIFMRANNAYLIPNSI